MKLFLSTLLTAAMLTVGCNLPTTTAPEADPQAWTPQISAAMGIAMMAPGANITPDTPVNKVKRSQCTVCRGSGQVKTGDGISWTECENCVPDAQQFTPEEMQGIRDSLKKMAALERYQADMQAWVKNDMERFVLASVAKRTRLQAATSPGDKLEKAAATPVGDPTGVSAGDVLVGGPVATTRTYSEQPAMVVRRGWFGRRGRVIRQQAVQSAPVRMYRGNCASGSCAI